MSTQTYINKRDLQKRPVQTKREQQKRITLYIPPTIVATPAVRQKCQKRPTRKIYVQRDLYASKETCIHQKRPTQETCTIERRPTTDTHTKKKKISPNCSQTCSAPKMSEWTYIDQKRPTQESCTNQNRPATETPTIYASHKNVNKDLNQQKRPTKETCTHQKRTTTETHTMYTSHNCSHSCSAPKTSE